MTLEGQDVYRNRRWNARVAVVAAVRGATAGLLVAAVPVFRFPTNRVAVAATIGLVALGALVPGARALRGRVQVVDDQVVIVNPFRTVQIALDRIRSVEPATTWQNFLWVAAIHTREPAPRRVRVLPVPAQDLVTLKSMVTRRTHNTT